MVSTGEWSWERVGAPTGGAVTALAVSPAFAGDATAFAATMAGLFRSRDAGHSWQRVGRGFTGLSLSAVAVSPDFARDNLVLAASLEGDLFRVTGDGATWTAGSFHGRRAAISALAISPHVARDGVAFAATLADGVFVSRNRGAGWEACTFGLLDLEVTALALSPAFARDETLFAATASGVFRSPNGGRAWRETGFPAEAPAVLCLAVSPNFAADRVLFAGTDGAGPFCSSDRGATWHALGSELGAACVNAIAFSPGFPEDRTVLLATDAGVYVSRDAGESWGHCAAAPGALCLALAPTFPDGPVLAGLAGRGVLRSAGDLAGWGSANEGLCGRRLSGLALSPAFAGGQMVVTGGAGEGVVWSTDGGTTWTEANEGLPSLDVAGVAVGTREGDAILYAALPEGIWTCRPAEARWEQAAESPARLLAVPPAFARDGTLLVSAEGRGIWTYDTSARRGRRAAVPWPEREMLALAVSPEFERDRRVFAILRQPGAARVEVWQGTIPGGWTPVAAYESAQPHAALAVPAALPWDGTWYAAIGEQFYGPLGTAERGGGLRAPAGYALAPERPALLALAALPEGVVAATERGVYRLARGSREWRRADDPAAPRAIVALALQPGARDGAAYALEVGGTLWRLHV